MPITSCKPDYAYLLLPELLRITIDYWSLDPCAIDTYLTQ
jgi:hypothetical protein